MAAAVARRNSSAVSGTETETNGSSLLRTLAKIVDDLERVLQNTRYERRLRADALWLRPPNSVDGVNSSTVIAAMTKDILGTTLATLIVKICDQNLDETEQATIIRSAPAAPSHMASHSNPKRSSRIISASIIATEVPVTDTYHTTTLHYIDDAGGQNYFK